MPDVLDEHVLRGGRPALHAIQHDHVRAGLHRERHVVVRPGRSDLDEDRLLPVGDLPKLLDLDLQVIGARPIRMATGAALIDALGQVAHLRHPIGDLLPQQHPAAAGLRALPDDDLDRVGPPQVLGVHAVARRQQLIDQRLGGQALLGSHSAVTRRGARPHRRGGAPERLLRVGGERAEAHPRDRDRDLQLERPLREAGAEDDVGVAALAITLERVARDAGAQQQQIVEVRDLPLRAAAPDVVDAGSRGALDLVDREAVERRGLAQAGLRPGPWGCPVGGGIESAHG